ncbi:polysaccharide biosynthesis/export family protein [Calditrichota bacterium LG25]
MIKMTFYRSLIIFSFLIIQSFAQETSLPGDYTKLSSLLSLSQQQKMIQPFSAEQLVSSIDENTYEVDSGDEFYIRVDVEGPDVKTFTLTVTSDGYLVFPEVSALYVRHKVLKQVKKEIFRHLGEFYNTSEIDVTLARIHPIKVSIIGALEPIVDLRMTSADRLLDALQKLFIAYKADTLKMKALDRISIRRIELIRDQQTAAFDLLKFIRLKKQDQNPLLRTNDVIFVNFKDSLPGNIYVGGQVGQPGYYEFLPGDDLLTMLQLAGGLQVSADSNRIEVYRSSELEAFHRVLPFAQSAKFFLQPGDQIFVRKKPLIGNQKTVIVEGQVKYPGVYPILEGQTKLSDVLRWAGGFTKEANPQLAFVQRKSDHKKNRLPHILLSLNQPQKPLTTSELSYVKNFFSQNVQILQTNFQMLLQDPSKTADFFLKDGDKVVVPPRLNMIIVSGGVKNPGIYPYHANFTIDDYVRLAGGYTTRVKKSMIKIFDGKTGAWLDAKEKTAPNPGDQIFIPRRNEWEFWPVFKEALTIVVQLGTIFIIIRSTK